LSIYGYRQLFEWRQSFRCADFFGWNALVTNSRGKVLVAYKGVVEVPVPATLFLFGLGLVGLGWTRHNNHIL